MPGTPPCDLMSDRQATSSPFKEHRDNCNGHQQSFNARMTYELEYERLGEQLCDIFDPSSNSATELCMNECMLISAASSKRRTSCSI
jgi:hypothetical protein